MTNQQWSDQRREAATIHAERLAQLQREQSQQARVLIAEFMARVTTEGPPPEVLYARSYNGKSRYRTSVTGWYLRVDRSAGIGTDGHFYMLTVAGGLKAKLRGATLTPSDPPIVLGHGGRDGESINIADALDRILRG